MNSTVYIFGELSSGYTQYPEDSSSHILKNLYQFCKAPTQIAIHRDANMMYYCYIRKLNKKQYIGLSIAVNGFYISRINDLFSLYENTIEKIAQQGIFIHFTNNGTLTTSTTVLKKEEEEIDTLSENLQKNFELLGKNSNRLPQVDYTVAKDSVKEFNILDDKQDIVRASYTYGYTFIYKDKDFNTVRMNSYRAILNQLHNDNNTLKQQNEKLKEQNTKILRQKKQFKNVIFLILAIIGCGIGLFVLRNNLNIAKGELDEANNTISNKNDSIKNKDNIISDLYQNISNLNTQLREEKEQREEIEEQYEQITEQYEQIENEYDSFKSLLSSRIPILITNIDIANVDNNGTIETGYGNRIYSSNSMYLRPRITYTGINTEKNITLYLRLYNSSGTLCEGQSSPNGYTFSSNMTVMSGENNTCSFSGWGNSNKGNWSRGSYRYEIWYGNVCLGSKSFSIY